MKLPSPKNILRNLILFAGVVLVYWAFDVAFDTVSERYGPLLHGLLIGGGILVILIGLFLTWVELKGNALIRNAPQGQKKPASLILLPLAAFLLMGAGMALYGLSYWWGRAWEAAIVLSIAGALLIVGASVLHEHRSNREKVGSG